MKSINVVWHKECGLVTDDSATGFRVEISGLRVDQKSEGAAIKERARPMYPWPSMSAER